MSDTNYNLPDQHPLDLKSGFQMLIGENNVTKKYFATISLTDLIIKQNSRSIRLG